jgi:branched-chain amino acid transport system permease protein
MVEHIFNLLSGGIFYGSTLFLVAAGFQVVFGVQKILNLACGSFYALGAYTAVSFVGIFQAAGLPPILSIIPIVFAGLSLFFIGPIIERGLLRFIYDRDEPFQLLLTFGIILVFEDVIKFIWGAAPRVTSGVFSTYGQIRFLGIIVPVYNLIVIGSGIIIALLIGYMLAKTKFGRIVRATADNREMSQAMGIKTPMIDVKVFTLGTVLGTLGGALVIPPTAATTEMCVDLVVLAFAVVVIGGLGSIRGAFLGAMIVGVLRSFAIATYPELELLLIYLVAIVVLILKPEGLLGGISSR